MTTGPLPRIRTDAGLGPGGVTNARRAPRQRTGRTPPARRAAPGHPSGWYWTVSIGSVAWRRPSTEPSLRLTWLTWKPRSRRQRVADDLDLVVLGGHLDEPEVDVADRVVRPVVPEPEPGRLGAGRSSDDLVAEADPEQRPPVLDDRPRQCDRTVEPRRVAGPRREDQAIDVAGEGDRGARSCAAGSGRGRPDGASPGRCST